MILFAAQDAGPAAYLAEIAKDLGPGARCLASATAAAAFARRGVGFSDLDGSSPAVDGKAVSGVVTGTCLGKSVEKDLVRRAASAGVPSISVIEHWSNYRERFVEGGELVLPDYILVNDEHARARAEKAGLPSSRLRALGNPVLEKAASAKPAHASRADWARSCGLDPARRIVVFVSEECGRLVPGTELGFDEHQVVADILGCLGPSDQLLIKLHPVERAEKYASVASDRVVAVSACDPVSMAAYADKIVGMGSMLLLEVAGIRGDLLSYRPGERWPFVGNEVGATILLHDRADLARALAAGRTPPSSWANGFSGSRARIEKFLAELAR